MREIKVSVIIPIYNVEEYLEECLQSVVDQTLEDLQVIMVDDGSLDGSTDIAKKFASRYDHFEYVRQVNGGLGNARNTGVKYAKGKYIIFLDSDDIVPDDAYEKMYLAAEKNHSEMVVGSVARFNSKKDHVSNLHEIAFRKYIDKTHITDNTDLIYDTTSWNKLILKEFWDRNHFEFPERILYEDIPVTIPMHYLANNVTMVQDVCYRWRIRDGANKSITQRADDFTNMRDRITVLRMVDKFFEENVKEQELWDAKYYKWLYIDLMIYVNNCIYLSDNRTLEMMKIIKDYIEETIPLETIDKLPVLYREKYVALGLALSQGLVKFTVVNLHGEIIHEETFKLPEILTPEYFAETIGRQIQLKIASYGYSENFIIGIGITVCGVVDFANGIILDSDGIWEEKNVPIVKMFRKQFSFPVIAANNVRSYANAYAFLQHDSQLQNMLFIRNEATMGVSLILNGQFYGGDRNLAAGIAHFTVVPNGRKCHCGKRGCLDTIASQDGMMASLRTHFGEETTPLLYEKVGGDFSRVTFSMFVDAAYAGDSGAAEIIRNAQEIFANAITFSIQLLDVQQIVFYGSMFENHHFFDSLQKMLVKKIDGNYKENFYKVVPSDMNLDLRAAPILVVSSFFGEGGHRNY